MALDLPLGTLTPSASRLAAVVRQPEDDFQRRHRRRGARPRRTRQCGCRGSACRRRRTIKAASNRSYDRGESRRGQPQTLEFSPAILRSTRRCARISASVIRCCVVAQSGANTENPENDREASQRRGNRCDRRRRKNRPGRHQPRGREETIADHRRRRITVLTSRALRLWRLFPRRHRSIPLIATQRAARCSRSAPEASRETSPSRDPLSDGASECREDWPSPGCSRRSAARR